MSATIYHFARNLAMKELMRSAWTTPEDLQYMLRQIDTWEARHTTKGMRLAHVLTSIDALYEKHLRAAGIDVPSLIGVN